MALAGERPQSGETWKRGHWRYLKCLGEGSDQ